MIHRSGPFAFDTEAQSLTRGGARVALSGKPLAILELLITTPGKLVTRADLKGQLWPNCERIDTERRLNTAMRALREALKDTAESPRFIETVRGRGYRWVGAPAPDKLHSWHRSLTVAARLMCALLFSASFSPSPITPPTPAQGDRFIAIAARAWRAPAVASNQLDTLLRERPTFPRVRAIARVASFSNNRASGKRTLPGLTRGTG